MNRRVAAWLAWSSAAVSAALVVGGVSLLVAARSVVAGLPYDGGAFAADALYNLVLLLPFSVVGALVAARQPRNSIGWIFCGVGLWVGLTTLAGGYAELWLAGGSGVEGLVETVVWFSSWAWIPLVYVPTTLLLLLFPDGRPPSPRWRFVVWCAVLGIFGFVLGAALQVGPLGDYPEITNPYGVDNPILGVVLAACAIVGACSMVASAASLIVRMRRAGSEQRQQIKWFAYGGVVVVATVFASGFISIWSVPLSITTISIALLCLPVFTGIAILRHRLYDIDIIINRTLVYGSLTATLAAVYFGGIVLSQRVFVVLTGREELPQIAIVASTLAIAALFNPLRRRIQAAVDRRFYRNKYDARKTLETFSARLREETDLGDLGVDLVAVVRETMQPEHVSLWLRPEPAVGEHGEVQQPHR